MWAALFFCGTDVITLQQAVSTALERQPQLREARENAKAAAARSGVALAPMLPQLNATGSYLRTTANFVARPGSVPQSLINATSGPSLSRSYDFWSFGLSLNQTLFDLGAIERWLSARENALASRSQEQATRQRIVLEVRSAYFAAIAQDELVRVAVDTLTNQKRHREQIESYVRVGGRPEIDLAQARTDEANAEVQKINAEVTLAVAKAQLNQAMGTERDLSYALEEDALRPVLNEDASAEELLKAAAERRPDVRAFDDQLKALDRSVVAQQAGYAPILGANASFTEQGLSLSSLTPNWSAGVTATWNLFGGLATYHGAEEAKANQAAVVAQRDALLQSLRVDIERTRLNVAAMKAAVSASETALTNAKERLRLAEGRYGGGLGNIIELGDAQIAATNAGAQRAQARFNLALSRAQLIAALGLDD